MKIISKYKDFYDFYVQDNDPDMVYVRQAEAIKSKTDELKLVWNLLGDRFNLYGTLGYNSWRSTNNVGDVIISSVVFGIYPKVYVAPVISAYFPTLNGTDVLSFYPSKSKFDKIMSDKSHDALYGYIKEKVTKLLKAANCDYLSMKYESFLKVPLKYKPPYRWNMDFTPRENPDVFLAMGAPVFLMLTNTASAIKDTIYYPLSPDDAVIKNVVFNKLNDNITRYYAEELSDINIYNRIENFLWASKAEPVANPDNKTKILAHGFDLKTSFRKM